MSTRASAISAAGTVLSQPTRHTSASKSCACTISSIESAITSREISDARIPGVACDWLSETAIVLKPSATPPAAATPSLDTVGELALVHVARHRPASTSRRRRRSGRRAGAGRCPSPGSARGPERAPRRRRVPPVHAVAARRGSHRENTRHVTRIRIGLLSTASINGAILGAAPRQRRSRSMRSAPATRRGRRPTPRSTASHAPAGRTRSCSRCRARRGLHRAPERVAPRVGDARARSRQARALREAVHAAARAGGRGVRRGRARTGWSSPRATCGGTPHRRGSCAICCRGWGRCAPSTLSSRRRSAATTIRVGSPSSAGARCSISAATASAPPGSCSASRTPRTARPAA